MALDDRTHINGNAIQADYSSPGEVKLILTPGDSIGNDGDVLTNNSGVLEMLPPAAPAASGADFQRFNASGTWTNPSGYNANSRVLIRAWGGGGSGACNSTTGAGGGGGGGYNQRWRLLSELSASETVTIGAGGTPVSGNTNGVAGGNTTFGTLLTAYGGRGGNGGAGSTGGGGGGFFGAPTGAPAPGIPLLLTDIFINFGGSTQTNYYQGHGGVATSGAERPGQPGVHHGGGGGGPTATGGNFNGGSSLYGGGGGAGTSTAAVGAAGSSVDGGNGGAAGVNGASGTGGVQPGGGGGAAENTGGAQSGSGADGRVEVFVFPPA